MSAPVEPASLRGPAELAAGGEDAPLAAPVRPRATATGAWPGQDPLEAARTVLGELAGTTGTGAGAGGGAGGGTAGAGGAGDGGGAGLPFAPDTPARGPGADPTGRAAALLVDTPVDLQPVGWRLVDRPGLDAARAAALLSSDLDALAEAADGYAGPLKLQLLGPWSLAASVWLPRGERAVVDAGAARDLLGSLAEGAAQHVAAVRRLVPGAAVVVQVDEPSLPAVLAGRLPTASGWGRLPAVDAQRARDGLRELVAALVAAGAAVVLRAPVDARSGAPLDLLTTAGAQAVAVAAPPSRPLGEAAWEQLAAAAEAGLDLHLGVLDAAAAAGGALAGTGALVDAVLGPWRRLGLPAALLARVVVSSSTGLAALAPATARAALGRLVEAADALAEQAQQG